MTTSDDKALMDAPRTPGRRPRPEPTERMDGLERREQILTCAMRLFEQMPYADVKLRDVAQGAGVGRPLVHHYFGTKRDLYLEVVRRLAFIPTGVLDRLPDGPLDERIAAGIDRWLTVAERHQNMWLTVITLPTSTGDPEVNRVLHEADQLAAERMIQLMRLTVPQPQRLRLTALVIAYGGLARSACREWLINGALTRAEVSILLTRTLVTIVEEVEPSLPPRE